MAVLIEGMEMPKGKPICIIIDQAGQVRRYDLNNDKYEGDELFEAIPIPEPHGRLGDLDAVAKQIDYMANLDWNKKVGVSGGMLAALETVEDAPTVIPASEDGEA